MRIRIARACFGVGVAIILFVTDTPVWSDFQPFTESFNYTAGSSLSTGSGGAWTTRSGTSSFNVVSGPGGSISGENVVTPNGIGQISSNYRNFGTVDSTTPIDLRFSAHTTAPASSNDLYVIIQRSTVPFPNDLTMSFDFGIVDGQIRADRGTTDTGFTNTVFGGAVSANTWYQFRALYIPAFGHGAGYEYLNQDVIDLSYRTSVNNPWIPLHTYTLPTSNSNELATTGGNLYSIEGRNQTGAQVMVADDASVQLEEDLAGRGHRILRERGLQIQALAFPEDAGGPGGVGSFNLNRFAQSNFTTVNLHRDARANEYLGPASGIPWGRWADTMSGQQHLLTSNERPYVSNLISSQYRDEQSITDPEELERARQVLAIWRAHYPDTIGYTNQSGFGGSPGPANLANLQNWVSTIKPDMVSFDNYPFNGNVPGGSPTGLYADMQTWRQLGLGGHDGTGQNPIPYGLYLQTLKRDGHDPSESEMRLNQFAAWAFGYTFADAFVYTKPTTAQPLDSSMFSGYGDSNPLPGFGYIAETNRQSRNLGAALVNLLSTDVRIIPGQHGLPGSPVSNSQPAGVNLWAAGADPFITGITADNLGTLNNGLSGDVLVGYFQPLQESDGDDLYFMIVNGLSDAAGTAGQTAQQITLNFDFDSSGISSLGRLNRLTGEPERVALIHDGGALYHLDLTLDGGTGDLFRFGPGHFPGIPCGDADLDGDVDLSDLGALATFYGGTSGVGWSEGDFDLDADVDLADLGCLATNYGLGANQAFSDFQALTHVPEPATCGLLLLVLMTIPARRRSM